MLTQIDFVVKKKIHTYIKYAFHLAVHNDERQIVSHVVTGVQIFQPIQYIRGMIQNNVDFCHNFNGHG